ncbi:MAG: fibronectin type III domain-containing protein, partial [Propionibacteriaceae bacterium]|nr:fibronectin type III domain-containing protein [Propionibacteriaceae bacterium]
DHLDATVPCQIPITVTASTRPLISVQQPILLEGFSGRPIRVDLEDYVSNPFPATPVRVLRTTLIQGAVALAVSSPVLVLTPEVTFHGPAEVQFILMDATNDNSRQVRGTLRLTVRGPPDAPTGIEAFPTSGKSAMVSFQAGEDNGAPIERYTVEADDGKTAQCEGGDTANCEIAGLTSGHEYTFKVSAANMVGSSEWSGWSERRMIDVAPEPLATPRVEPADRAIKVTWTKPHTDGSAISQFRIHLAGRDNAIMVGPDITEREIGGLTNGQEYSVSIEAVYASGSIKSDSAAAVPFGKPNKPERVTVRHEQPDEDAPDKACVRVGWDYLSGDSADSNNGRPVDKVLVSVTRNGTELFSRAFASGEWVDNSVKVELPPGSQTTALVSFSTEAGASEPSQSELFQAHGFPTLPSLGSIAPTGNDHEVRLTGLSTVAGNGWDGEQLGVQYRIGAGSWYNAPAGCYSGCVIVNDIFQNGTSATLHFRQFGRAGDFEVPGPSFSAGVTPYGPPLIPKLTFKWLGDHRVKVSWVATADNGGPGLSGLTLKVEGHAAEDVLPELSGSRDFQFSGDSVGVQLTATEEGRSRTATAQGSVTWGSVRVVPESQECPANALPPLLPIDVQATCSLAKISIERAWSPGTDLTCEFTAAGAGDAQVTIPEESVAVTTPWRVLDESNPGEHIQCLPKR